MSASNPGSVIDLSLLTALDAQPIAPASIERRSILFDRKRRRCFATSAAFGLATKAEDVVQEVFLSLFDHLRRGRPRDHLKGWLFRVAHNLALRQWRTLQRRHARRPWDETAMARDADPSPNPESRLAQHERHERLASVFHALPERDRQCLSLRAEGLGYREIAGTLGISLGSVAKSLTRAVSRLVHADQR